MVIRTEEGLVISGREGVGQSRLFVDSDTMQRVHETNDAEHEAIYKMVKERENQNIVTLGGGEIGMNTLITTVATNESISSVTTLDEGISFKIGTLAPQKVRGFEIVSKYADQLDESFIPQRGTAESGGHDLRCAEDTVIPSLMRSLMRMDDRLRTEMTGAEYHERFNTPHTIEDTGAFLKKYGLKPTLVPTGVKAFFPSHQTLDIQSRSGMPLKTLLIIANAPGLIDADYYNNENNEGHIFVQFINLSPFDIIIKKGEKMAQGVFRDYYITDNDQATAKRVGGFNSTGLK